MPEFFKLQKETLAIAELKAETQVISKDAVGSNTDFFRIELPADDAARHSVMATFFVSATDNPSGSNDTVTRLCLLELHSFGDSTGQANADTVKRIGDTNSGNLDISSVVAGAVVSITIGWNPGQTQDVFMAFSEAFVTDPELVTVVKL